MLPGILRFLPSDPLLRRTWMVYLVGHILLAALFILLVLGNSAHAAEATAWMDRPSVVFLLDMAIVTLGPLAVALLLAVLGRIYVLLGLQQTRENRETVEQVLLRSIGLARRMYGLPGTIPIPQPLEADIVRTAAEHALDRGPNALASIGVRDATSTSLQKMIIARLDDPAPREPGERNPNDAVAR